ncbi:MAG: hypothetical protein WC783_04485 [Candidatus Paceibacterota bacterium]|jgi:hypothetical protein
MSFIGRWMLVHTLHLKVPSNKKGVRVFVNQHDGTASRCAKCRAEKGAHPEAEWSVSGTRPSALAWILILALGAAIFAAKKLPAQAASTPTATDDGYGGLLVLVLGILVVGGTVYFLSGKGTSQSRTGHPRVGEDHSGLVTTGEHGVEFLRARAGCDSVVVEEPEPGKITGSRLIKARETRPH